MNIKILIISLCILWPFHGHSKAFNIVINREINNIEIITVNSEKIIINKDDGIASIPIENFSEESQKEIFGYFDKLELLNSNLYTSNKIYYKVKILDKSPIGIKIIHSRGESFVQYRIMNYKDQKKYGYDPKKEKEFLISEREKERELIILKRLEEITFYGEILSIIGDGILIRPFITKSTFRGYGSYSPNQLVNVFNASINAPTYKEYGEIILIMNIQGQYVDNDIWKGKIYKCGKYNYTNALGSKKTIWKYTASKEVALDLLREEYLNGIPEDKLKDKKGE